MIAALEAFQRSKPFQAAHLLGLHLARHGRLDRRTISPQSRRRLSLWLGNTPHRSRPRPAV